MTTLAGTRLAGSGDSEDSARAWTALGRIEAELDTLTALDVRALGGTGAMDLAARLVAVTSRLSGLRLAALAAVEDSGAWASEGARSMFAAVARREDASFGSVRAEVVLAQRLDADLPLTAAALRDGSLSVDKAKLMARLAPTSQARRAGLRDPDRGEAALLAKAKTVDIRELTRLIEAWGYRIDPAGDDRAYRDARPTYQVIVTDVAAGTEVHGLVSPETGEILRTALRAVTGVPQAGDGKTTEQRNAEALHTMARFLLDAGEHGEHTKVRPHLNVSVGYDTLLAAAGEAGVDPATFTETGRPVPRVVLDRLACDSEISRVIFGPDGIVLDAGRTARIVSNDQRRAVITRDRECQRPGCHAPPRYCEVHHRIWWDRGGGTSVEDSVLLCWHDHDWVHREDITITRDRDRWIFTDRHGKEVR
jgi:Domain of unknown function (DUF222)/HNH endonuclease